MGRAIVRNPKVFLFDEPLSNLDAKLRGQVRIEIKKLQQSMNVTSVFVTHDQVEAMTLGDRLAVINNGVIEQLGTPIEVYEKPASRFVAEFIGSPQMNFINGTIKNNIFESKNFKLNIDLNIDNDLDILDIILLIDMILYLELPEECYIIPEVGPCDGICPTYFYNQDTNQCEEFITGCCGVDAFNTLLDCLNICE